MKTTWVKHSKKHPFFLHIDICSLGEYFQKVINSFVASSSAGMANFLGKNQQRKGLLSYTAQRSWPWLHDYHNDYDYHISVPYYNSIYNVCSPYHKLGSSWGYPSGPTLAGPNTGSTVCGALLGNPGENIKKLGTILPLSHDAHSDPLTARTVPSSGSIAYHSIVDFE